MAKWTCGNCAARMTVRPDLVGTFQKCLACGEESEVTDDAASPLNPLQSNSPKVQHDFVVKEPIAQSPLVPILLAAILITLILGIVAYALWIRHQEEKRHAAEAQKRYDDEVEAEIRHELKLLEFRQERERIRDQ